MGEMEMVSDLLDVAWGSLDGAAALLSAEQVPDEEFGGAERRACLTTAVRMLGESVHGVVALAAQR